MKLKALFMYIETRIEEQKEGASCMPTGITLKEPEISFRFDVDDIRKIRDYNSQRHSNMTHEEIVEDIRKGAEEIIKEFNLDVTYARKLS